MRTRRQSFTLNLSRLRRVGGPDGPTMAEAAEHLAEKSALLMILLVAAISVVPSPGLPLGFLAGMLIIWLSAAALKGDSAGRLPASLSRRRLPRPVLEAALRRLVPLLRRIERRTAPRLPVLVNRVGHAAAMAGIAIQGLLLAVPLPFGNLPPAIAIVALTAGLLWRDGLGVLAGHVLSVISAGILGGMVWSAVALIS